MKIPHLPDRDKTTKELARRYEEVLHKAEGGVHNDDDAQQFTSLLAHYVNYVKKSDLTQDALTKLFAQQELIAGDKILIDEADKIIEQLKKDRDKVVRFAKRKGIDTSRYDFDASGAARQITPDKEVSFHLTFLDDYLDLPSDQQQVSQLPRQIGRLRSMIFVATQLAGETPALKKLRADYGTISSDFAKKLKMQGVYVDYLRVEDYRALELVWQEVYQEGSHDDRIMFHLMYGDLFEKNRAYSAAQQADADEFVSKHITHLQRVHNYLIDCLEDVSFGENLLKWTVEHFGPTLVSLILIVLLSLMLNWLGVSKGMEELRGLTGL